MKKCALHASAIRNVRLSAAGSTAPTPSLRLLSLLSPSVLSSLSEKKTVNGDIARFILKQVGDNELEQIVHTFVRVQRMRQDANRKLLELGTAGDEPPFKPERLLSFVQSVMNGVCWAARRLYKANERPEYGNGQDFSQETAELVGVYCTRKIKSSRWLDCLWPRSMSSRTEALARGNERT